MEGKLGDLGKYRLERAKETLITAEENLNNRHYVDSLNRSYYAVFHAVRAVNSLYGFDSKKHSGVISFFNQNFIRTGIFDKQLSDIIKGTSFFRNRSDYEDFYIASRHDAETQLHNAKIFVNAVSAYLEKSDDGGENA